MPQTYSEVPERLKGTKDMKLVYSSETEEQLHGYSYADWANNPEIRRSVSGYTFIHTGGAVTGSCRRQSTASVFPRCCDNRSACRTKREVGYSARTKHIDLLRQHFINELLNHKAIVLQHVSSENQRANALTNPVPFLKLG